VQEVLTRKLSAKVVVADKEYDSEKIRGQIISKGAIAI
jgi:hypothetical protein